MSVHTHHIVIILLKFDSNLTRILPRCHEMTPVTHDICDVQLSRASDLPKYMAKVLLWVLQIFLAQ